MISFPRLMPTVGAVGVEFEPDRADYLAPEAGGSIGAISAGFPRWVMRVSLGAMTMDAADVWRAWLAVQRGPQRPFIGFDIDRQLPKRHALGRPYAANASGWSQAIDEHGLARLTLTGLLPGQAVSTGDYIGFGWGAGRRALVRAVESANTGASGVTTVAVEPPLPPVLPADAIATFRRPGCLMRLVPGETKLAGSGLGHFTSGSTIVAVQDLIR